MGTTSEYKNANKITEVVIPEGVKKIGGSSFALIDNLTTVTLPSSLESIDTDAFNACKNLATLNIPDSLKPLEWRWYGEPNDDADNRAFKGCGKLSLKTRQRLKELGYNGGF